MPITRVAPSTEEHLTRDEELLKPNITGLEMFEKDSRDGHLTHERWVVDIEYGAKPQWGKPDIVTAWSPCCGRPRQRLKHGYAFSCPGCGWWWRYHQLGWTCRFVSIGKDRPK